MPYKLYKPSPCVGIRTCSDYSPFGVELDGRTVSGGYRYGYQGSECDSEVIMLWQVNYSMLLKEL